MCETIAIVFFSMFAIAMFFWSVAIIACDYKAKAHYSKWLLRPENKGADEPAGMP